MAVPICTNCRKGRLNDAGACVYCAGLNATFELESAERAARRAALWDRKMAPAKRLSEIHLRRRTRQKIRLKPGQQVLVDAKVARFCLDELLRDAARQPQCFTREDVVGAIDNLDLALTRPVSRQPSLLGEGGER